MLFVDRPDGRRVHGRPALSAIMPYLMRKRNESTVYFEKDIDIEEALRYVKRRNQETGSSRYSLFGLVMAAGLRTIMEKPSLNRFVHRRALYDRRELCFSFIVKKQLSESAAESSAKVFFEPGDSLDKAMERIEATIARARGEEPGPEDREIRFAHRIPGGKALITFLFRLLDRWNLAPAFMIRNDPLFATAWFANLGSLGLDAPYHHLYEWGTASIFVAMGRIEEREAGRGEGARPASGRPSAGRAEPGQARRRFVTLKITVDERISEGIVFAHAAARFRRFLEKPELLEEPPARPA
jgi:hypothetical protein